MRSAKQGSGTRLYGIIGYPLSETWSPHIYRAAFNACGMPHLYVPFPLSPSDLDKGVAALSTLGVQGFSVTVPHKETLLPILASSSPLVKELGAVNTVIRRRSGWHGENTDMDGFARPLSKYARRLKGRSAVIMGAGGAARAVAYALIRNLNMSAVLILSRRKRAAERVVRWAQSLSSSSAVSTLPLGKYSQWRGAFREAALVVQATPLGGPGYEGKAILPKGSSFRKSQLAYDLVYARKTPFLVSAHRAGAQTLDGREMLLHQAALAFALFTGDTFPERKVRLELNRRGPWRND